jgi:hypothetical protein
MNPAKENLSKNTLELSDFLFFTNFTTLLKQQPVLKQNAIRGNARAHQNN